MKRICAVSFFVAFCLPIFPIRAYSAVETISFLKSDRVLVIAPHPDDETLGAGGLIRSAVEAGAEVKILYLTHGDHNEIASIFYQKRPLVVKSDFLKSGQIRKEEAVAAMAALGLSKGHLVFLGYPDFGTLAIWRKHWGSAKPFRSFLTRINKDLYREDLSYGNPYRGENIVKDFEKVIASFRPTQVFVTPPFDLNPDHRAAYLYLQVALLDLENTVSPEKVYCYLIHAHKWPQPKKYLPENPLEPPPHASLNEALDWIKRPLTARQVQLKNKALSNYKSQSYSKDFLFSFVRSNELFFEMPYEALKKEMAGESIGQDIPDEVPRGKEVIYRRIGDELWADVSLNSPLDELGAFNMEVFGYKKGAPFLSMPKINLRLFGNQLSVRLGYHTLDRASIPYYLGKKRIWIRVPMSLLKYPDTLFVSVRTAREEISLDFGSWKVLKIQAPSDKLSK